MITWDLGRTVMPHMGGISCVLILESSGKYRLLKQATVLGLAHEYVEYKNGDLNSKDGGIKPNFALGVVTKDGDTEYYLAVHVVRSLGLGDDEGLILKYKDLTDKWRELLRRNGLLLGKEVFEKVHAKPVRTGNMGETKEYGEWEEYMQDLRNVYRASNKKKSAVESPTDLARKALKLEIEVGESKNYMQRCKNCNKMFSIGWERELYCSIECYSEKVDVEDNIGSHLAHSRYNEKTYKYTCVICRCVYRHSKVNNGICLGCAQVSVKNKGKSLYVRNCKVCKVTFHTTRETNLTCSNICKDREGMPVVKVCQICRVRYRTNEMQQYTCGKEECRKKYYEEIRLESIAEFMQER